MGLDGFFQPLAGTDHHPESAEGGADGNTAKIRLVSLFVGAVSVGVMADWIYGLRIQEALFPGTITMKFTTALLFFLLGAMLFLIPEHLARRRDVSGVLLPMIVIVSLSILLPMLFAHFIGVETNVNRFFVEETAGKTMTRFPGAPSVGTTAALLLAIVSGISVMQDGHHARWTFMVIGMVIVIIGLLALIGYALSVPWLYYDFEGTSNPIAVQTAALVIAMGYGIYLARGVGEATPARQKGGIIGA